MKKKPIVGAFPKRRWLKILLAMKIVLFLILAFSVGASASVYSQNQRVNLKFEDATILDVLNEIRTQTGISFFYNDENLAELEAIDLDASDMRVDEVLSSIFENTNLQVVFEDEVIMIVDKPVEAPKAEEQQEKKTIKGTVTDDQGIPLPGVSVVIKGTNVGVATDIDGNYTLNLEQEEAVLVFSFVGMSSREISYTGQLVLNVTLTMDAEQMSEVVVTGYQTIEKGRATGSFKIIKNEEMDRIFALDYKSKLEGTTPGLSIDRHGKINIRGIATFGNNTEPLFVVDGIPLPPNGEKYINPSDIELVSVLKDAASASIWGVRASNGVIVITTKKGKKGKTRISVNSDLQITERIDLSERRQMSASDYVDLEWNLYKNHNGFPSPWVYGAKQRYSGVAEVYMNSHPLGQPANMEGVKEKLDALKSYDNKKGLEKWFYRTAVTQKHNVSISGGNKDISYYTSIGYDYSKASLKRNNNSRINLLSNITYNASKNSKISLSLRTSHSNSENNGIAPDNILPYTKLMDKDGNYLDHAGEIGRDTKRSFEKKGFLNWRQNQLEDSRLSDNTSSSTNVAIKAGFETKFLNHFKYNATAGFEITNSETRNEQSLEMGVTRDFINQMTSVSPSGELTHNVPVGGILSKGTNKWINTTFRNVIQFDKTWENINVRALVGNEILASKNTGGNHKLYGYSDRTLTNIPVNMVDLTSWKLPDFRGKMISFANPNRVYESKDRFASFFSTVSVGFLEHYNLFSSWRLDKSNVYSKSSSFKNNPSWSVGFRWDLFNDIISKSKLIDNLDVKLSYGLSGNIDKSTSPEMVAYSAIDGLTGTKYLTPSNPENKELGWEKTRTFNVGVNYGLFKNVIFGSIEYYNKDTKDVLSRERLNTASGWESTDRNSARILNRGVEFSINAKILDRGFKWLASINHSYNKNEIKELDFENPTVDNYLMSYNKIKGFSINRLHVYRYAGMSNTGEPLLYKGSKILKSTELSQIEVADLKYAGVTVAPHFGSLTNKFQFKNFTLNTLITYKFGHKFLMPYSNQFGIGRGNVLKYRANYWRKPGDEKTAIYPKLSDGFFPNPYVVRVAAMSDDKIENAGIIRLKSVTLGYNLDKLLERTKLSGSISVGANNLAFWSKNKYDLDSDYVSAKNGGAYLGTPARTYFISLKLNL